ncbi:MAG TPA: recombinase family protein, partial [Gemmatimonadaceae bacterium]
MAPKVYSYARWSTPRQGKGHSPERQLQAAREYAARETNGLVVDEAMVDEGRSAFRGSNVKKGEQAGALGRFLERIEAGEVERGSVLVLENLDRMSRMAPRKALNILSAIVDKGIAVHTTNDGQTYTAKKLDSGDGLQSLLIALLAFNTANQESVKKGTRLRDVWEAKRKNALLKPLSPVGPKWLRLNKATGKWKPIPERVEIVRRIFQESIAGKGVQVIARTLNEEGVPVFGSAKHWHRAYIVKLLDNPAVIGTLVPHILTHDEETGKPR